MWDDRYNLPTSPQNQNPHFYTACAWKLVDDEDCSDMFAAYDMFTFLCEWGDFGLYNRWPHDNRKGNHDNITSHDELMGMVTIYDAYAENILEYLWKHKGYYNNTTMPSPFPLYWNLYKFPWFIAYLKAKAEQMNWFWDLTWAVCCVIDGIFVKSTDAGGRLRMWMMLDTMNNFPCSNFAIKWWVKRMKKTHWTLEKALAMEPKENPIMSELAIDRGWLE